MTMHPNTRDCIVFFKRTIFLVKNKIAFVGYLGIFITVVFFGGVSDSESMEMYRNKMQNLSRLSIPANQRKYVISYYLKDEHSALQKRKTKKIRKEFNRLRTSLKQDWQLHSNFKWPVNFEAHHIIPLNAGGINQWWNIFPLSNKNHHLLHQSVEEHACFSHDIVHRYAMRFVLRLKLIFRCEIKHPKEYKRSFFKKSEEILGKKA